MRKSSVTLDPSVLPGGRFAPPNTRPGGPPGATLVQAPQLIFNTTAQTAVTVHPGGLLHLPPMAHLNAPPHGLPPGQPHAASAYRSGPMPSPRFAHRRLAPVSFVAERLFSDGVTYKVAEAMATIEGQRANPVPFNKKEYDSLVTSVRDILLSDEAQADPQSAICLVNEANAIVYRWNQALGAGQRKPLFYFKQANDDQTAPDAFAGRGQFSTVKVTPAVAQAMQTIARLHACADTQRTPALHDELAGAVKAIRDFPGRWNDPQAHRSAHELLDAANDVLLRWQAAEHTAQLPLFSFDNAKPLSVRLGAPRSQAVDTIDLTGADDEPDPVELLVAEHWPEDAQAQRFRLEPESEKKRPADASPAALDAPPTKRRATATATVGTEPLHQAAASTTPNAATDTMPTLESPPVETLRLSLPARELDWPGDAPAQLQPSMQALTQLLNETGVYLDPAARKRQVDGVYAAFQAFALAALRQGRRDLYELAAEWALQWVNDVNHASTEMMHTRQPGLLRSVGEAGLLQGASPELKQLLA